MSETVTTRPMTAADLPKVSELHAAVFGPGRFTRTAYRVRERAPGDKSQLSPLNRVAMQGSRMIAAINFSSIRIGGKTGAVLLGPLAVDPAFNGQGNGRRLLAEALEEAKAQGVRLVVLVGDEPYYGRFGFKRVPPGRITFPGPADPARILAAEIEPGAATEYQGLIEAV